MAKNYLTSVKEVARAAANIGRWEMVHGSLLSICEMIQNAQTPYDRERVELTCRVARLIGYNVCKDGDGKWYEGKRTDTGKFIAEGIK